MPEDRSTAYRNALVALDFIFVMEKLHQAKRFKRFQFPDVPLQPSDPTDRLSWQ
jgi:hypothetical protein